MHLCPSQEISYSSSSSCSPAICAGFEGDSLDERRRGQPSTARVYLFLPGTESPFGKGVAHAGRLEMNDWFNHTALTLARAGHVDAVASEKTSTFRISPTFRAAQSPGAAVNASVISATAHKQMKFTN